MSPYQAPAGKYRGAAVHSLRVAGLEPTNHIVIAPMRQSFTRWTKDAQYFADIPVMVGAGAQKR
jgi:hypothetical protein